MFVLMKQKSEKIKFHFSYSNQFTQQTKLKSGSWLHYEHFTGLSHFSHTVLWQFSWCLFLILFHIIMSMTVCYYD